MLVVKIELWPGGRENEAHEIGRMLVANDGTGTADLGDYDVRLLHAGEFYGKPGNYKTGRVLRHLRKLSPYHLVQAALDATLGARARPAPASSRPSTSRCKGCSEAIVWVTTPNGKKMPLNPDPEKVVLDSTGKLLVVVDDGTVHRARRARETDLQEPVTARTSHFASCPAADRFRGER